MSVGNTGNIQRFGHVVPFGLEASLGLVSNYSTFNKFGQSLKTDSGIATDIFDLTFAAPIWVPPKGSRFHVVNSTDVNDTLLGTGARTIQIWGLKTWTDLTETTEIMGMNGTSLVVTANPYVIIHRATVLTWGSLGVNAGFILGVAAVDITLTFGIISEQNQTQMAIFGVSANQRLRMTCAFCEVVDGVGVTARANGKILQMIDPAVNTLYNKAWVNKENFSAIEGTNPWRHCYADAPKKFDGPCIIKIQVTTNANDTHVIAGFEGFIYEALR